LLPNDPKRRLRTLQTVMACLFTLGAMGFMVYGVLVEAMTFAAALTWSGVAGLGGLAFIIVIRNGWSERLADPSMTVAQMVFAISCCAWAYALTGPLRGGIFSLLMVAMMFGMFALPIRKVLFVGGWAVLSMGLAMAWLLFTHNPHVTATVEAGHLLMLALMMPAVAVLAERLRQMRRRLHEQKRDLAAALDRIQYLATRDALTGLMNRGHLGELLDREVLRHRRCGTRMSVVLLDIDHFKQVNDRFGHGCGDQVLRRFAEEAQRIVRGCDALGRWGGEEFLLLMPETGLDAACVGAERLRKLLQGLVFEAAGQVLNVTLSAGVAQIEGMESIEMLVERADRALYMAKDQGRNRVQASVGD
jgi:diguanylate cyclase (GGDEF)-like protein